MEKLLLRGTAIEIDKEDQGKTGWLKVNKAGGNSVSGYCHTENLHIVKNTILKENDLNIVHNVCSAPSENALRTTKRKFV